MEVGFSWHDISSNVIKEILPAAYGSDNLEQIADFLIAADDVENDTAIAANYPAFYFEKNYRSQTNSHVSGTTYESGWYLPTLAELYDIWKVKETVNFANCLCESSKFGDD